RKRQTEKSRRRQPVLFGSCNFASAVGKLIEAKNMQKRNSSVTSQGGFTLIELMLSLVTLLVISGSAFQLMNLATQRSATEQTKLDLLQEGREFMDQMSRDLRQAGYPNPRNFASGVLTVSALEDDTRTVVVLIHVAHNDTR